MGNHETPKDAIAFLTDLEFRGKQPSTVKRYKYDLEDYLAWIRVNELGYDDQQVYTTDFIQTYFDFLITERSYSYRTLKRVYSVLKQYHLFLYSQRKCLTNPMNGIEIDNILDDSFTEEMFLSKQERETLLNILSSPEGLTENQLKAFPYLSKRNLGIITLMINYGLSLHEVSALSMSHLSFINRELKVITNNDLTKRTISLSNEDSELLYDYYTSIPSAVRPVQHTGDPFFVAFDFKRLTYRWSYETNKPKRLTEIAIQKMIRQEIARAGLRKGISAQHFRRTAILNQLKTNQNAEDIQHHFGMKTSLTLNRYLDYLQTTASH
ncbi:tyrosine-type recombinase/integrase [Pseudalkalibacillus berkeleyi]|uniref:Site-specific integrase n=1 Tax=Pseudalkalibacillus berkeleyi TaxID=1069813 RepID=A0ABS9GZU6_9BACL|nr:site-specific integrase [Pseudalkalibacillus berkeleyi]MCF6137196.1 site-specific integrase [Pseudalkalibacillus berkeleyi]